MKQQTAKVVSIRQDEDVRALAPESKLSPLDAQELAALEVDALDNDALRAALKSVQRRLVMPQLHKDHRSHSNNPDVGQQEQQ